MIVGNNAPGFSTEAYYNEEVQTIELSQYKGKWVVLFFYGADFTFV